MDIDDCILEGQLREAFSNKRNIKKDVDKTLLLFNMTEEDILYVRDGEARMSRERFLELADVDYDSKLFKERVNHLFVIVCINAIMFYDTNGFLECIKLDTKEERDFPLVFTDEEIEVANGI